MVKFIGQIVVLFLWMCLPAWGEYPMPVAYTVAQANVQTSSTIALTLTDLVKELTLINNADVTIYCNPSGAPAIMGEGIPLTVGQFAVFRHYTAPIGSITCIHGGVGTKKLNYIIAK